VYSRADISRTVALAVALSLTAFATGAVAREFRAADTQNEDYPTVQALRYMGRLIAENSGGRHHIRVFHSRQLGERSPRASIHTYRTNPAVVKRIAARRNGGTSCTPTPSSERRSRSASCSVMCSAASPS